MSLCDRSSEGLADFLEARREEIARRWEERMRASLSLLGLSRGEIIDSIPEFLAALVAALRGGQAPAGSSTRASVYAIAEAHGRQRFRLGLDISAVVREYSMLREVILELLHEGSHPLEPEALGLLVDVIATGRAEALRCHAVEHEQALRASEAKLQDIIDHAPAVISAKDAEGRYLFVNHSFEEQLGASRQRIVGRTDYDCFSKEVADTFRATDAEVLATGRPLEVEEEVPQKDGPHLWRSLKFPLPGQGERPYATCCISTDITQPRRLQRERDEARERLSRVLSALPIVFWSFDNRGVFSICDGQALERVGLKPGQLVGQSVFEIFVGYRPILDAVARTLRGEAFSVELEFRDVWFEANFLPERGPDGAVRTVSGLALDITERRRTEVELRQSETRYRLATLATSDAVWDWDLATNRVHWSDNIYRITGRAWGEVDPALDWWAEHVHPEDRERVVRGLYRALDGAEAHWMDEYRFRRGDGSYMFVSDRGYVVRDVSGRAVRMVGALQDITERKVAEQDAQRRADFEQLLIGIVSHDLRNPLNAIAMAARLMLKQEGLDEPRHRSVERILSSAERATRMLTDLLDFTQARLRGRIPVEPRPLDLHELTRHVVEEVQLAHPQRQLVLEQAGDGHGEWDADRLAQVITNLVNNALTYGSEHSSVRVRTQGQPHAVLLSVHNTGAPISAELLGQLFQPLRRGEDLGPRGNHSIGLGLFIVKHIVHAHGGSISVESTAESGTTFTVSLPRKPPRASWPSGS